MIQCHKEDFGPARLLVDNIQLLPTGEALDVAMGKGRNAVYLAKKGFDVEGVDIAPQAVRSALDQAREVGVTLKARVADLEIDYHIEKSAYDLIICLTIMSFLIYFVISGVFTIARES